MRYEELLPAQLSECVAEGRPVVVPVSQLEPQGDLLPLGADKLIIERVLEEASKEVKFVVLPTFHVAACTDFRYWPGLIHFTPETTISVLRELAQTLVDVGFSKLLFVMYYGGHNFNLLDVVMGNMELAPAQSIKLLRLPNLVLPEVRQLVERGIGAQYALLAYLRPDLVDEATLATTEELPSGREEFLNARRACIEYNGALDLAEIMPQGPVSGFHGATANDGAQLFERFVEAFVAFLQNK